MNHIIVTTSFALNQDVMVYMDGECKEISRVPIDKVASVVNGMRKKYNIDHVDLYGEKDYLQQIAGELKNIYDFSPADIEFIGR